MPAAEPSKAGFQNVLSAIFETGLQPINVRIEPDGAYVISLTELAQQKHSIQSSAVKNELATWGEVS